MEDLTIIYYTCNKIPEDFAEAVRELYSNFNYPIISVSQKPINLGRNIIVGEIGQSNKYIFLQSLIGMQLAYTEYVALCEDDVLYPPSYFEHRPENISYNHNKYDMYIKQGFFLNTSNKGKAYSQIIGKRDNLIKAVTERIAIKKAWKPPAHAFEPGRRDEKLGVSPVICSDRQSIDPVIDIVGHGMNISAHGKNFEKKDRIKTDKIPYWGSFNNIAQKYRIPGHEKCLSQLK